MIHSSFDHFNVITAHIYTFRGGHALQWENNSRSCLRYASLFFMIELLIYDDGNSWRFIDRHNILK